MRATSARVSRFLRVVLSASLALALVPAGVASGIGPPVADEFYVDADFGSDLTGDGSAGDPWQSITFGMTQAGQDDTLWVEPGTYDDTIETFPINVTPGVMLRSTSGADVTLVQSDGSARVFNVFNPTEETWVKDLTITGGSATIGSAIYVSTTGLGSTLTGWPKIMFNTISENGTSTAWGGAIATQGTSASLASPYIYGNTIELNDALVGGGIRANSFSAPTIAANYIANNTAVGSGGGVSISNDSYADITGNDIVLNTAANGAGIEALEATVTVKDNWISMNDATAGPGGGAWLRDSSISIEANEVSYNTATTFGAGLALEGCEGEAIDNLLSDNVLPETGTELGGAMRVWNGSEVDFSHGTVVWNIGEFAGIVGSADSTLTITNSILWENDSGEDLSYATVSHSIVQDTDFTGDNVVEGSGVIHSDPLFFDDLWDYRLTLESPGIDSGLGALTDADDRLGKARPKDGDGDGSSAPDMGCHEKPEAAAGRKSGTDRYGTACEIAKSSFTDAYTAVIASGETYPDALSAAGLAGALYAPLLLVRQNAVPDAVLQTLLDLGVQEVVIVGGTKAVSSAVETQLNNEGYLVTRISGTDRYDTSAEVAREIDNWLGPGWTTSAFFARGNSFPDGLSVAPLAYSSALPVLLVRPDALPSTIANAIDDLGIDTGYICGGTNAVSGTTKGQIDAKLIGNGGSASTRWSGVDRYDTAKEIAEGGAAEGFVSFEYVGVATGAKFPDALAGGVVAGNEYGVLLLTRPTSLPDSTKQALANRKSRVERLDIYGGTTAVSASVVSQLESALTW